MPNKKTLLDVHPSLEIIWSPINGKMNDYSPMSNRSVTWKCFYGIHEDYTRAIFSQVNSGLKCPKCPKYIDLDKSISDNPKLYKEYSIKNDYSPILVPKFSNKKVLWECCKCSYEYLATPLNRSNGSGCPVCSNRVILTGVNDVVSAFPETKRMWSPKNKRNLEEFAPRSMYKGLWVCHKGHEWAAPISRITAGHGCPYCSGNRVVIGVRDVKSSAYMYLWSDKNTISPSEISIGSGKKVWWKCPNGHPDYLQTPADKIGSGKGCKKCSVIVSKQEDEISDFLKSLGVDIVQSDRKVLGNNRELDLYIPSEQTAVEFNGLYWHSERTKSDHNYHYKKWLDSKNKGIRLITVWEDDWEYKKEIVKTLLQYKLGLYSGDKVYARQTEVVEISYKESSSFLNKYHIQGSSLGTYYLGLKRQSDLVAVMVLRRIKDCLTLDRYATSCQVVGGQTKLLSYVDRNYSYTTMTTFADLSISDGSMYKKTGWTYCYTLPPDYKYVVGRKRVHKFNYRKSRFKSDPNLEYVEGLTEKELAQLNGIPRIWDCGKMKFTRVKGI